MNILYIVNNAAFFCSHRLPIALAAVKQGCSVTLITGMPGSKILDSETSSKLFDSGINHFVTRFRSGGYNFFLEFFGLIQLIFLVIKIKPDLIHCASPKGLLYGGIAARLFRCKSLVLAVSGMGSMFAHNGDPNFNWLRFLYLKLIKFSFGHKNVMTIVQNSNDFDFLVNEGISASCDVVTIRGSGVFLNDYIDLPILGRDCLVVLPARILKDKGVEDFVQAARIVRESGRLWRFVLVGTADYDNPSAISMDIITKWVNEGVVEWWGHQNDMSRIFSRTKIVCLPSYREGMPKALLEAAAAGCAVITTDAIGCRDAIIPGVSGDLVPIADPNSLAIALIALIDDPDRINSYGVAGRIFAKENFDINFVIERTLDIYARLSSR